MDKSREQFEAWAINQCAYDLAYSDSTKRGYRSMKTKAAWKVWQASRAAIEIDTGYLLGDGDNDTEWTEGYNDGIQRADRAIRAAGLKVKGDDSGETDLSHQR